MKYILHPANKRGHNNFSWLDSYHSFSFGHFYDDEKMNFGVLRVLNDDVVSPGMGFGTHPHSNMEIVSIPLEGALEHNDSMGTSSIIRKGDVQIMSAGTGLQHSEFNHSKTEEVKFLQIWVFPRKSNLEPTYDQKTFDSSTSEKHLKIIVDPHGAEGVKINQDAWFSIWKPTKGEQIVYDIKKLGNGVYVFVISGSLIFDQETLNQRDSAGFWDTNEIALTAIDNSEILLMDIPMQLPS